jgi:hypothetical protein
MRVAGSVVIGAVILALLPKPASADGFITPFIGVNFGGAANSALNTSLNNSSKVDYGVAARYMSHGIVGVEEEFGDSPNLYGSGSGYSSSSLLTLMTNVVLGIPVGGQQGSGVRPYGVAGVGLIRQHLTAAPGFASVTGDNAAWDLGFGVMGFFGRYVGLQGDIRYFRNFNGNSTSSGISLAEGTFNTARASIGIAFRY